MKVVQILHGNTIAKSDQKKIEKIKSLLGEDDTYELIKRPKNDNYLIEDETWKIDMASTTPDMLFIDIDIIIDKIPKFKEKGLPYFSSHPEGECSDLMIFYVNDCCGYFKDAIAERDRRNLTDTLWWNRKVLRSKPFHNIPETSYDRSKVYDRDFAHLQKLGLR